MKKSSRRLLTEVYKDRQVPIDYNFKECIEKALDEFREEIRDRLNGSDYYNSIEDIKDFDAGDIIHEIADNNVPIKTWDILSYATHCFDFAIREPDIYAFDGQHTAINAIAGNMYEALAEALYNELDNIITKEVL